MNEEERSNLYIYTYSDLDDDFVFAETKYTLGDLHKLQQENGQLKKEIKEYQEELSKADSITQSCIFDGAKESAISYRECLNELDKYKSLYENEKDHTDTLKRIIKKIEYVVVNEELGETIDGTPYYLVNDLIGEKILDLVKEIK